MPFPTVLMVTDDGECQTKTQSILAREGIGKVACLRTGDELPDYLDGNRCDLVMLDLGVKAGMSVQLIGDILARHPEVAVVAISDADEAATAVSCIHRGAYDYLVKPLAPDQIASVARRALGLYRQRRPPAADTRATIGAGTAANDPFEGIITQDPVMASLFAYARAVANSGQAVLVTGETGTGKDLMARAVHDLSGCSGPFVPVNTAGMDDTMFSDALFGHRRGAFTGATDLRPGLVLRASSGTLFLDEIGDLTLVSQVKLLRLLQDGDYYPLGSDLPKKSTARIIAATSADLHRLQAQGLFRKDLYYRLRAHLIEVPPLRTRTGDIPLLLRHFITRAASELGRAEPTFDEGLPAILARYAFPGNVRELRSLVYDAVCRTAEGDRLSAVSFATAFATARVQEDCVRTTPPSVVFPTVLPTMTQMQDLLVDEALHRTGGNQAQAAAMLGISRQALNKRLSIGRRQPSVNRG